MYNLIIENKELLKIFYALIIGIICAIIVIKTDRLFRLSFHQGIRYFRNAFLFYGLAFFTRYFIEIFYKYNLISRIYSSFIDFVFEFFLIMAGFFLLYSLLWKKIEFSRGRSSSSLFNLNILIFYLMAFVIALLDYLWGTRSFMFFSQIVLFTFASGISYNNHRRNGRHHRFLKFYFIAMLLSLLAWLLNSASLYFQWNQVILIGVYLSNIIIFLLFLYGIVKVTRKW
ncbi:MAG: hypothetical protein ABH811_02100 [archaeon]